MKAQPHVVIVGGGFAGLYLARDLGRLAVQVTLIDRTNHHLFQPMLYQVATAALAGPDISSPIRSVLRHQRNTEVLLGEAVSVETRSRAVVLGDGARVPYDYLVLATGTSRRQIHTIAEEIDAALRAVGERRLSIEGYEASKWVVQDYGDIVVHVFDAETRNYYNLEDLWADAPRIDWERH